MQFRLTSVAGHLYFARVPLAEPRRSTTASGPVASYPDLKINISHTVHTGEPATDQPK